MRVLISLLMCLSLLFSMSSTDELKVQQYERELNTLDQNQTMALIVAYWAGRKHGFELTLTSIVWKESSFGKYLSNSRDGRYGSFGIAQILLETAMRRLHVKSHAERRALKARLLTDTIFNLQMAIHELNYWKLQHKVKAKEKRWLTYTIASYNAGWKSVEHPKGLKYSKDVLLRIKALKRWFKKNHLNKYKVTTEHLRDIRLDLRKRKFI